MIFVTVGTHEQQFDRLIKEIDRLKESRLISEEIFMQTGFCNYIPKACDFEQFYLMSRWKNILIELV